MTAREQRRADEGFTLIELLIVVAVSSFIMAAMATALLGSLKILVGLSPDNSAGPGVQNTSAVNAQLDASSSFPTLMRDVTSDLLNSRPADLSLANTFTCVRPAADPALPTASVLFTATMTDAAGTARRAVYEYSADIPRFIAQIVRYECAADGTGTAAEVVAEGLNSTRFPIATTPATGLLRLVVYSVTERAYTLDAHTRVPGPAPLPGTGAQAMTLLLTHDVDADGQVDRLTASFGTATPEAACRAAGAWSVRPVGGPSVTAAAWSGSQAELTVENAPVDDTSVDAFIVSFLPPTGCESLAAVVDATPVDDAPPVLLEVTNNAGSADGTLQGGDTLRLRFSERLRPESVPADAKVRVALTPVPLGTDRLDILPGTLGGQGLTGAAADTGGRYAVLAPLQWAATASIALDAPDIVVVRLDDDGCVLPLCAPEMLQTSPTGNLERITPAGTVVGYDDLSAIKGDGVPWPTGYRLF